MFVSDNVICIAYIDDCLWFAKNKADIDVVLQSFKEDGDKFNWEMTKAESVAEYLVNEITRSATEGLTLFQTHLLNMIIVATGLQDCNSVPTLAVD